MVENQRRKGVDPALLIQKTGENATEISGITEEKNESQIRIKPLLKKLMMLNIKLI